MDGVFKIKLENLRFYEPRLLMSHSARFFIRLIIYSFYIILVVADALLLSSDIEQLFYTGIFIFLFLLERIAHLNQAERSIIGLTRYLPRLSRRGGSKNFPKEINAADFLTSKSLNILEKSYEKAFVFGGDFYLHLIKFLIERFEIRKAFLRMDIDLADFNKKIDEMIKIQNETEINNNAEDLIIKIENLVKAAFLFAAEHNNKFIEPHDLLSALSSISDQNMARLFNIFSINTSDFSNAMLFSQFVSRFNIFSRLPQNIGEFAAKPYKLRHRVMNRAWTARPTPNLDRYGVDFTDLARHGRAGFLIGHKTEYDRLIDVLSRVSKPNAMLVGEAGSGKETLIAALSFGIIKDEVPNAIFDKRLVSLEIGRLISGAEQEEISKRLNKIAEEITLAGNIILYIPDIHNLFKTSRDGSINAADILSSIISNDDFPVIGATYPREFKEHIDKQSDFKNYFEMIRIEEVSEDEAVKILTYESLILENKYKTMISFGAIKETVFLAHKYFRNKLLPSSAQDLLKEVLANATKSGDKLIQANDVVEVVERKINVPIRKAGKEEAEKLLNLENFIHKNFIDQEEAVKAVAQALREYRSGLSRKGGPIAAFLFVGPTGVGKTELSKILAQIQFGSEDSMIRFDMSEYQNKESIFRFLGGVDGNISGNLTESIMQKPYSLILLDEFEKANGDILNLFLQVFDDGRLTDSLGRTADFTNAIIIATSNAHSSYIKERIEAGDDILKIGDDLKKKLSEYFKPELINRFSRVVIFKNLSLEDTEAVARLQLKSLVKLLENNNGLVVDFSENAVKKIAEMGYDPVFGARPLRGVISDKIKSVLAQKILNMEINRGDKIKIDFNKNNFEFINV